MDKEMEELLVIGVIGFLALMFLSNTSAATTAANQAKLAASTDTTYANDAAGVLGVAINDWS